jgi:uncharacterized protein YggE
MHTFVTSLSLSIFLSVLGVGSLCAHETSEAKERWVSVTGTGEVEATPDVAVLKLGVISTGKTTALATEVNNKSIRRIINVLKDKGIEDDDYETSRFQLIPQRQYRKGEPPKITGFQVSNLLIVRIYELGMVGQVMQAAIDAGGNNFESLSYMLEEEKEIVEEARVRALEDAVEKAELMCNVLDVALGKPLSIQEIRRGGHSNYSPMMMESADALRSSVPVKGPSHLRKVCEVQVKFSIK